MAHSHSHSHFSAKSHAHSHAHSRSHSKHKVHMKHHMKHHLKMKQDLPEPFPKYLPDANTNGFTSFSEFVPVWEGRHVTVGEIKAIFEIADLDSDNKVSGDEWNEFKKLFIDEFEQCDADGDNELTIDELNACLELPIFKLPDLENDESLSQYLFNVLDTERDGFINFPEYLFFRKTNLGWKKCSVDNRLSKATVTCAFGVSNPGRRLYLPDAKQMFDMALIIFMGQAANASSYINFKAYFELSYVYYIFQKFEIPFIDGYVEKKDVMRALDQQALPLDITPQMVEVIFNAALNPSFPQKKSINFFTFASLFSIYVLFDIFNETDPNYLEQEQFYALLESSDGFKNTLKNIDGYYSPTQEDIEAYFSGQGPSKTENDFLINRFLQISSKQDDEIPPNQDNRDQIFKLIDSSHAGRLNFHDFVQFFKWTWYYNTITKNTFNLIQQKSLTLATKQYSSPIFITTKEKVSVENFADFLGYKYQANFKHFMSWFNQEQGFSEFQASAFLQRIMEEQLTDGLDRLGFKICQNVLDASHEGSDSNNHPLYNYKKAYNLIIEADMQCSFNYLKDQASAARR